MKAGSGRHELKYRCGDILVLYDEHIEPLVDDLYGHDAAAANEARRAFQALGHSDGLMVDFISGEVIRSIDEFIRDVSVAQGSPNRAEGRRLELMVTSAQFSERLQQFAGELAGLILEYARLAKQRVTIM
jgi:hypothetical protein